MSLTLFYNEEKYIFVSIKSKTMVKLLNFTSFFLSVQEMRIDYKLVLTPDKIAEWRMHVLIILSLCKTRMFKAKSHNTFFVKKSK